MSALAAHLRRACVRAPMLRSVPTMSAAARLRPVTPSAQLPVSSRVVAPLAQQLTQVRCYSGADPLNMQFIHDRCAKIFVRVFEKCIGCNLNVMQSYAGSQLVRQD